MAKSLTVLCRRKVLGLIAALANSNHVCGLALAESRSPRASDDRGPLISLDFVKSDYRASGSRVAITDMVAASRATMAWESDFAGEFLPFRPQELRMTDRGLRSEAGFTNLVQHSTSLNDWAQSNEASRAVLPGRRGPFRRVAVGSAGSIGSRAIVPTVSPLSAGATYAVSFWFEAGTSGKVLLEVLQSAAPYQPTSIGGPIDSVGILDQSGGGVSGLRVKPSARGIYEASFLFKPKASQIHILAAGPFSTRAGETVIGLGAQIGLGKSPSSIVETEGAAATRHAEGLTATGPLAEALDADSGTLLIEVEDISAPGHLLSAGADDAAPLLSVPDETTLRSVRENSVLDCAAGTGGLDGVSLMALAWGPKLRRLSMNGGITAKDRAAPSQRRSLFLLAGTNGLLRRIEIYREVFDA